MADKKAKAADVVRITSIIDVDGKRYQPNQLVKNLPQAVLDACLQRSQISTCEAGVEYCKKELKADVIDHAAKPEEKAAK